MTTKHNAGEVAHHARMVWGDKAAEICRAFAHKAYTANSRAEWLAAAKLLENANPNDTTTTVGGNDR